MIDGKIVRYNCSCLFLKKKHFCSKCATLLKKEKRTIVVNSDSEDAKHYDFFSVDTYLSGNIEFITFYFKCPNCSTIYEIEELKKLEKERKKKEHR